MHISTSNQAARRSIVIRSCLHLVALLLLTMAWGCGDPRLTEQTETENFVTSTAVALTEWLIDCCDEAEATTLGILDDFGAVSSADSVVEAPMGNATQHSLTGGETAVPESPQDIVVCGTARSTLDVGMVTDLFGGVDECGPQGVGLTVCPEFKAMPSIGEYLFVFFAVDGPIPLESEGQFCEYAVVFDSDGDSSNNFRADPEFENDFFDNTDRRYKLTLSPGGGWTLQVSNATNTSEGRIASTARAIIRDNVIVLAVSAAEFKSTAPSYRVTAFCHDGDYGLDGGPWSGDLFPNVGQPLQSFD